MTKDFDSGVDAYLWDPAAPPVAEVVALERLLGEARAGAAARPLELPRRIPRVQRAIAWSGVAAAAVVLLTVGYLAWRSRWPVDEPWHMQIQAAGGTNGTIPGLLEVGEPLLVETASDAHVNVARIGTMRVGGGSELTLQSTASNRHRLVLTRGTIDVRVWAPPRSIVVETPAGDVRDLGCRFHLVVDAQRVAHVTVLTGWVQIDNVFGETLVPAGASADMSADRRPLVPLYDDAPAVFRTGVRAFEMAPVVEMDARAGSIGDAARARDVVTLLVLAMRTSGVPRAQLLRAAMRLSPPPAGVNMSMALGDNNAEVWRWYDSLPLPPPKSSWWRNWRDGLPRWVLPESADMNGAR